jgi:hypothetical protein
MSESDDFDALLAARFAREHTHVAADPFVANALLEVRSMQKREARVRIALRVTALLVIVLVSPWLMDGVEQLNAALNTSFAWTAGAGTWALALLALCLVAGAGLLRRR